MARLITILLLIGAAAAVCEALRGDDAVVSPPLPSSLNCTWTTFKQPLDHFSPGTTNHTFEQRICLYTRFFEEGGKDGPVFL